MRSCGGFTPSPKGNGTRDRDVQAGAYPATTRIPPEPSEVPQSSANGPGRNRHRNAD